MLHQSYLHIFSRLSADGSQVEELRRRFGWPAPPTIIEGAGLAVRDLRLILADSAKRPLMGGTMNIILLNADAVSHEVANTLLKSIEEPPEYLNWHLITTNESKMLVTIVSRCQRFRYGSGESREQTGVSDWDKMTLVQKLEWSQQLSTDDAASARLNEWMAAARASRQWLLARSLEEVIKVFKKPGSNKRLALENFILQGHSNHSNQILELHANADR